MSLGLEVGVYAWPKLGHGSLNVKMVAEVISYPISWPPLPPTCGQFLYYLCGLAETTAFP
jgi:hypothetical protein